MKKVEINEEFSKCLKEIIASRRNNKVDKESIYLVQIRQEVIVNSTYDTVDVERLYFGEYTEDGYPTLSDIKEGYFRDSDLPTYLIKEVESKNNLKEIVLEFKLWAFENEIDIDIEILDFKYIWKTIAYFLTIEDAKNYLSYQKHNLGVSRIYSDNMGYRNAGTLAKLLRMIDNEELELLKE